MKSYTIREVEARNEAGEALDIPERVLLDITAYTSRPLIIMIGSEAWRFCDGELWQPANPKSGEEVLHYTADGVYDNAATGAAAAKRKRGG